MWFDLPSDTIVQIPQEKPREFGEYPFFLSSALSQGAHGKYLVPE